MKLVGMEEGGKEMARERPALRASSQAVRIILQPVRTSVLVAVLLALQLGLLQHSAHAIDFTLASQDGYFYPALDDLLASPTTGTVLGTLSELESLADPATGVVKISSGRKAVIASSFFSIFSTVKFPLWRVETLANGSSTNVIPAGFAVSPGKSRHRYSTDTSWRSSVGVSCGLRAGFFCSAALVQSLGSLLALIFINNRCGAAAGGI